MPKTIVGNGEINISIKAFAGKKVDTGLNKFEIIGINGKQDSFQFSNGLASLNYKIEKSSVLTFKFQNEEVVEKSITLVPAWFSILPPLIAIALALLIKEVLVSLFLGILSGLIILNGFSFSGVFSALLRFADQYLLEAISDSGHLSIIIFSLLIGAMVFVITENGSMRGLVEKIKPFANTRKKTLILTWFLGILIFFDDYANSLIVGNTMRPVTDKYRISREKLAYLVDSTAAPVASIAFITTWIGAQLDYIQKSISQLPISESPYKIFLSSLQYSYYPIFTLLFIFILIILGRDFGPMVKAELKSLENGNSVEEDKTSDQISNPWFAILPVFLLVSVAFAGLFYTGYDASIWHGSKSFFMKLSEIIGESDAYVALLWGSLISLLVASILSLFIKGVKITKISSWVIEGFKAMLPALSILILAWVLSIVVNELKTSVFLSGFLTQHISPFVLPSIIFILAATVSFATGSSWGTMAILYPIVLPLTYYAAHDAGFAMHRIMDLFYQVVSIVLAGSVFGDHCSPISDTTILSSLASDCVHIEHVRTQLPYAIVVGLISLLAGYLPSAFNIPSILSFASGIIIMVLIIKFLGVKTS